MLCPRFMAFARSRCSDESNGIGQTGFFMVRWPGKKVLMKIYIFIFFHSSIFCGYCLKTVTCQLIIWQLLYGLLLLRTVARVTCCFKRWQAITNDKKWQIKDNQCWSTTSARKTVGESSALCQSVDKQRWKVATETNMTYMTNKGGRWQQRIYDKQRWKVATETNMTTKTDSNMDWDNMV